MGQTQLDSEISNPNGSSYYSILYLLEHPVLIVILCTLGQVFSILELYLESKTPPLTPEGDDGSSSAPIVYNENLTLSSYQQLGDPPYSTNSYLYSAILCADAKLDNMSREAEFVQYWKGQISQDVVISYATASDALCLIWPNVLSYNVENYRSAFLEQ